MTSITQLLTTARRFVDGVCAIPDAIDLAATRDYLVRQMDSNRREFNAANALCIELREQLAAEREAHEKTRIELGLEKAAHDVANQAELRAEQLLSAARADLEALTVWNLQSEKPCPVPTFVEVSINSPRLGICLDRCGKLEALDSWRFTPESLAAWKAQEGGEDG